MSMFTLENIKEWVISGLIQNFVWVIVGVWFFNILQALYDVWRYGKWQVIITENEKELLRKKISPLKAKQILNVPEDKLVYLKGLVSPFATLYYDLLETDMKFGLYVEDRKKRTMTINLDKNILKDKKIKKQSRRK